MSRANFEAVLAVLYKMFPTGICAGGYPRDILTGAEPKDIDFWLPRGFDAAQVQVFVDAIGGTVVSTLDAGQYGMAFDEERIAAIYQVQCGNGVLVDIIETKFAVSSEVLRTFTDNFSSAAVLPAVQGFRYGWAHPEGFATVPDTLIFYYNLLDKCTPDRKEERINKIQSKWANWVNSGRVIHWP